MRGGTDADRALEIWNELAEESEHGHMARIHGGLTAGRRRWLDEVLRTAFGGALERWETFVRWVATRPPILTADGRPFPITLDLMLRRDHFPIVMAMFQATTGAPVADSEGAAENDAPARTPAHSGEETADPEPTRDGTDGTDGADGADGADGPPPRREADPSADHPPAWRRSLEEGGEEMRWFRSALAIEAGAAAPARFQRICDVLGYERLVEMVRELYARRAVDAVDQVLRAVREREREPREGDEAALAMWREAGDVAALEGVRREIRRRTGSDVAAARAWRELSGALGGAEAVVALVRRLGNLHRTVLLATLVRQAGIEVDWMSALELGAAVDPDLPALRRRAARSGGRTGAPRTLRDLLQWGGGRITPPEEVRAARRR